MFEIDVSPVGAAISDATVMTVFGHCGRVVRLEIDRTSCHARIAFADAASRDIALQCQGICLPDPVSIVAVGEAGASTTPPPSATSSIGQQPGPLIPQLPLLPMGAGMSVPFPGMPVPFPSGPRIGGNLNSGLFMSTKGPPLTPEQIDQVARTVYVGNVSSQVCSRTPARASRTSSASVAPLAMASCIAIRNVVSHCSITRCATRYTGDQRGVATILFNLWQCVVLPNGWRQ
jgi:hypothetical protein